MKILKVCKWTCIVLVVIALIFSIMALIESKSHTHFCNDKNTALKCIDVSPTMKTCYQYSNYKGAKRCWSYWRPIENE